MLNLLPLNWYHNTHGSCRVGVMIYMLQKGRRVAGWDKGEVNLHCTPGQYPTLLSLLMDTDQGAHQSQSVYDEESGCRESRVTNHCKMLFPVIEIAMSY